MSSITNWLTVVQGLIVSPVGMFDDRRVLMALRPTGKKYPALWEYPGGKVDKGETLPEALKRELKEELCIDAEVGQRVAKTTHLWDNDVEIYLFVITSWKGEMKPLVADRLLWVRPEEVNEWLPLHPAAYANYREVVSFLKGL